jgi:hypothetical protein
MVKQLKDSYKQDKAGRQLMLIGGFATQKVATNYTNILE